MRDAALKFFSEIAKAGLVRTVALTIFLCTLVALLLLVFDWHNVGMKEITAVVRTHVVLVFSLSLFTGIFSLIEGVRWRLETTAPRRQGAAVIEGGKEYLKNLTSDEKRILMEYIGNNVRVRQLDARSGITHMLEVHGILVRASNIAHPVFLTFAYSISEWALEFLKENPNLLMRRP